MALPLPLHDVMAGRWRKPRSKTRWVGPLAALVVAGAVVAGVMIWRERAGTQAGDAARSAARVADGGAGAAEARGATAAATVPAAGDAGGDEAKPDAALPDAPAPSDAAPLDAAAAAGAIDGGAGDSDDVEPEAIAAADPEAAERSQDPSDDRPAPPPPRPAAPLARTLPAVTALIKKGERELAISSVHAMWKRTPKDARLPYLLGNLYFDKRWWTIGMQYYNAAIARSPAYKGNQTLIRNVISAIGNPKTRGKATYLLTKVIGSGAKGLVRAASKNHADLAVRKAAQSLIKRW
jgi:hypothetical protein